MKHTQEEIINALQVIKDECVGKPCIYCPFSGNDSEWCNISEDLPKNWEIKPIESVWKAFKED